jgi:catechol 2,3-dioxygenase-like lactoylglutathione lyase family enzyme
MQAGQLKTLTAAVKDVDAALATFQKNFGFALARRSTDQKDGSSSAFLTIGAAEIELRSSTTGPIADSVAARGEGLFQIELEVADLQAAHATLTERGLRSAFETDAAGRRLLRVDVAHTHGVPLVLSQPA